MKEGNNYLLNEQSQYMGGNVVKKNIIDPKLENRFTGHSGSTSIEIKNTDLGTWI